MLSDDFLSPYRKARDPFTSLLARSTYLGKYCRDQETWTDTIARVVLGNVALDSNITETEAHRLFDIFWKAKALPPGRGLWTGGVPNVPVESRYNCYATTLQSIDDWCWTADMLMCGGGVGIGLHSIDELPTVERGAARLHILCSRSHANVGEVMPDPFIADPSDAEWHLADDSRKGWVEALRATLAAAFAGRSIVVNVSAIRKRGATIKTFGGVACGPAPLATLLRHVWAIVRSAQGRRLSSVECLDVTNHIGVCIKSGNVRRSALIVLGKAHDTAFRDAKKDWQSVMAHRHSSNNSIVFETEEQIDAFDWTALVEDMATYGEPGVVNLWKARQTDPGVTNCNPCGEQFLENRESCNLSEVYPAKFGIKEVHEVFKLVTRYTMRQRLQPMVDPISDAVRVKNMRIGVGLGGICDFEWVASELNGFRHIVRSAANEYATELDVVCPITTTTVKPSGTISLLNDSSPGIHAPFAPYYVRRTRIGKDEPMAAALVEANVPHEPCVYDSTGQTLVFSFPTKAPHTDMTVQTQTVGDQIARQVVVQQAWADNAVSSTVSFSEDEKGELVEWLSKYAKDLKSISCLPKAHGYEQPPYSACTEEEYSEMHGKIDHEHPLTVGGDLEVEECSTGSCPVR